MLVIVQILLVLLVAGYIALPFWGGEDARLSFSASPEELERIGEEIEQEILALRKDSKNKAV